MNKFAGAQNGLAGGASYFFAFGMVSVASFLLNLVVSRVLGPRSYGSFGSVQNAIQVLAVPVMAISAAVTRAEASNGATGEDGIAISRTIYRFCLGGLFGGVILAAFSPWIRSYLHLTSTWPVLILAFSPIPTILTAVLQGVLMGRLLFRPVAVATLIGSGAVRLVIAIVLVEVGAGYVGAVSATVIGLSVTALMLLVPLWSDFRLPTKATAGIKLGSSLLSVFGLLGAWVFVSEDTFLAKHFLASREAGLYVAMATAGRIALFLPGAISQIAFPSFVKSIGKPKATNRVFWWSLIATAALGMFAAILLLSAPELMIRILFGSKYLGGFRALRILGFEAAILGVINLLVYFQLSRGSILSQLPWAGAVVAFFGLMEFHSSLQEVAWVMLLSSCSVTFIMLALTLRTLRFGGDREVQEGSEVRPDIL